MRQSMEVPEQQLRVNTEFLCAAYKPHIHLVPLDGHVHKIASKGYPKRGKMLLRSQAPWLR